VRRRDPCGLRPGALHRCLATTDGQKGRMVRSWMTSALLRSEQHFNKIMGHRDLWALGAILNPSATASQKTA